MGGGDRQLGADEQRVMGRGRSRCMRGLNGPEPAAIYQDGMSLHSITYHQVSKSIIIILDHMWIGDVASRR